MIKLEHPIKDWLSQEDIQSLFTNTTNDCICLFNSFTGNLEKLTNKKYPHDDLEGENLLKAQEDANKFKGDMFELFVEFLIKYMGHDSRIAIKEYKVIQKSDIPDYGVDGYGTSTINSKPATVQVKYRQANHILTWNDEKLGNLFTQSILEFFSKVPYYPKDSTNMLVVTAGKEFHYTVNQMSGGTIRCIHRDNLRELTDNVEEFWKDFRESIITGQLQKVKLIPKKLRLHQTMAVNAVINDMRLDDGKGTIILPTGTGKTLIQAQTIIEANKEFGYKCFVIFSPRILLSFQHLCSISEHLTASGIDANYLNLNSGSFDESIINEEKKKAGMIANRIISTTNSNDIKTTYEKSKLDNKILVISSTYHSAQRIKESTIDVDIQINDEAHNMVSTEFGDLHHIGKNEFSFTATEKVTDSDEGLGMKNETLWGNRIFNKLPKEMIDTGEILPVSAMTVRVDGLDHIKENDYNSIFKCIEASFACHETRLTDKSADINQIGAKLLVTVDGQATLKGIINCEEFEKYRQEHPEVNILAISSEVGMYINGILRDTNNRTKETFLRELQNLKNTEKAIIFYVDMLTEGIDVPGITAFMPLRGMCESRFLQGMGRAMRLCQEDRKRFYAGEISPKDMSDYIKPEACVIIPEAIINTIDNATRYCKLWQALYDNCGITENVLFAHYNGITEKPPLASVNKLYKKIISTNSGIDKFMCQCLDRPDILNIDEIQLVSLLMENENLGRKVYEIQ